jgi:hypothetical protein
MNETWPPSSPDYEEVELTSRRRSFAVFTCRQFGGGFVQRHEADDTSGVHLVTCRQSAA